MQAHAEKGTATAAARRDGLIFLGIAGCLFLLASLAMARTPSATAVDFKALYFAARCVLQGVDPYDEQAFMRVYRAEGGDNAADTEHDRRVVTTYINLPTGLVAIAPFALLPLNVARTIWMLLIALLMSLAAYCIWRSSAQEMPVGSAALVSLFLLTSIMLVDVGNSAGIVIPLLVLAACAFVRRRFVAFGTLALALGLVVKPHDAGFVWLFFVLVGAPYRKWAMYALVAALLLSAPGVAWIAQAAPHWPAELHRNLAATQVRGDINDPGPAALSAHSADAIVDLQTIFSLRSDSASFYNPAALLVGGALLVVWSILTVRAVRGEATMWLALAAAACLTMLPLYHRQDDARLILLMVPACSLLYARMPRYRLVAPWIAVACLLLNGDLPTLLRNYIARSISGSAPPWVMALIEIPVVRPVPIALLGAGCFFLWMLHVQTRLERFSGSPIPSAAQISERGEA